MIDKESILGGILVESIKDARLKNVTVDNILASDNVMHTNNYVSTYKISHSCGKSSDVSELIMYIINKFTASIDEHIERTKTIIDAMSTIKSTSTSNTKVYFSEHCHIMLRINGLSIQDIQGWHGSLGMSIYRI